MSERQVRDVSLLVTSLLRVYFHSLVHPKTDMFFVVRFRAPGSFYLHVLEDCNDNFKMRYLLLTSHKLYVPICLISI